MKKISILMLSMLTLPSYAQSLLGALKSHQESVKSPSTQSKSSTPAEVKPSPSSISSSSTKCEENDQTSLPLAYVTSLIQSEKAKLEILHDPRSGTLSITAEDMIGNCSSMLEWKLKQPEIMGKKSYAVEVKIKNGEDCSEKGCSYKVAKVQDGSFVENETMIFKPTLKGFEECLEKSGVIAKGKIVPGAIYPTPVKEKFSGLEHTGPLLFLSHGPSSAIVKAKYGKFEHISGCDYYEAIDPQIKGLLTQEDADKERLDAEAAKLKGCTVDEYSKVADFIERYENYSSELGEIRDRLILEAAKKSAKAIGEGKYTEEDLKVLSDFERYVVTPKVELAISLFNQMIELEGDAKKAKQEELKLVLAQISGLNQKPYFLSAHTQKLINDGRFEEAEKLNSFKLVLEHHQRLGAKQDSVLITPEVAAQRIVNSKAAFTTDLAAEKERYEIRTGQVSGKSQPYTELAARMRNNIQIRTQNFMAEIQLEYERIQQPNGYCYKYWRNAQKCIQETQERIQQLQAIGLHYNKIDTERAAEYDAKAKYYSDLEAQGRRHIATQNGEEPTSAEAEVVDTTKPTPRPEDPKPGVYNFDYKGGGQAPQQQPFIQQSQFTPQQQQFPVNPMQNMFQQQQNPWMAQQQQNPWLGQQSYGMQNQMPYQQQGAYNFNWGGGAQNQYAYQQPGYWNQPQQAYNQYSYYGR